MKLKEYLQRAGDEDWAVPQINFSSLEQFMGIVEVAKEMKTPIILGTSEGEAEFIGMERATSLVGQIDLDIFINLDHGGSLEVVERAIGAGYDMVHIDGSHLSLEENIRLTKKAVGICKESRVIIEGEVGVMKGGSDRRDRPTLGDLPRVEDAQRFVKETGVDVLALVVGNLHGIYDDMPEIDMDLLREAGNTVDCPLVFHGGSGVDDFREIVSSGVAKVNFNTRVRKRWRQALEESLEGSSSVKPYKILPEVRRCVEEEVREIVSMLGSQNKMQR